MKKKHDAKKILLFLFCASFILKADENLKDKEVVKSLLKKMFIEDQELNMRALEYSKSSQENIENALQKFGTKEQNINHCKILKKIISIYDWPKLSEFGKEAAQHAWIIVQHADHNIKFQQECLERMEQLVVGNEIEKKYVAYLFDRVQVNQNKLQRYGTQIDYKTGLPKPLEEPVYVNERRTQMELESLEEYLVFYKNAYRIPTNTHTNVQ